MSVLGSAGGQSYWSHDEGWPAGTLHTYDALTLPSKASSTSLGSEAASYPPRKIHVLLPRSYDASSETRYPVLYFNDGHTSFFPAGLTHKTWAVHDVLARLYASGCAPEAIVVAVHPHDRDREYTHAPAYPGRSCCGVPAYAEYLTTALKPFIDTHYRTLAEARHTTIVGSSHGGLCAFYVAATRPGSFGNAVAMSPSFWVGLDAPGHPGGRLMESDLLGAVAPGLRVASSGRARPRLYLDWGLERTGGEHNAVVEAWVTARGREMRALLADEFQYVDGRDLMVVEAPTGTHDEASWHERLAPALEFVLRSP